MSSHDAGVDRGLNTGTLDDRQRVQGERAHVRRFDGSVLRVTYDRAHAALTRRRRLSAAAVDELDPRLRIAGCWYDAVLEHGVCVIPDFLSRQQSNILRDDVCRILEHYEPAVQRISNGADRRIFGAENGSDAIRQYAQDLALDSIRELWLGPGSSQFCIMANQLTAIPGNLGSGGQGWHRDSLTSQIKTILYLDDVGPDNGPYQYIRDSHKTSFFLKDARIGGISFAAIKFPDEVIDLIVNRDPDRLMTFEGSAGTLIVADTTGIHRGKPIVEGVRTALTTYTFPKARNQRAGRAAMLNHYKPVLGVHVPVNS